jgi:hypothetical protein
MCYLGATRSGWAAGGVADRAQSRSHAAKDPAAPGLIQTRPTPCRQLLPGAAFVLVEERRTDQGPVVLNAPPRGVQRLRLIAGRAVSSDAWLHRREQRVHRPYCVDITETKAEDAYGAGNELRPTMNNIPERAHNSEKIAEMRQALHVGWARLPLTKPLTILLTSAAVGLSATVASEPQSSGTVAAGVARSLLGGVILGSNAWPSVPVDVQARLLLWSPDCSEEGRCRWVSAAPIDE